MLRSLRSSLVAKTKRVTFFAPQCINVLHRILFQQHLVVSLFICIWRVEHRRPWIGRVPRSSRTAGRRAVSGPCQTAAVAVRGRTGSDVGRADPAAPRSMSSPLSAAISFCYCCFPASPPASGSVLPCGHVIRRSTRENRCTSGFRAIFYCACYGRSSSRSLYRASSPEWQVTRPDE